MKRFLQIATIFFTASFALAQETITISMGAGYAEEVYYKLSTQTQQTFTANSWDVAFLREDPMNHGVRVNGGIGIQVFEASNNPNDWNAIDIANEGSWTLLYNDDTNWDNGAFMQGSATYGWGEYNPVTHHIEGSIIFVLKYADGTYRKFIIDEYFNAYSFRYATWNGTNWINENNVTVDNTNNPNNRYNYYSLQNNQEVIAEPAATNWDMVFTKYYSFLNPPGSYYNVSGVLHNPNVTVAQNEETTASPDPNGLTYSEEINTIGYDWKSFNGSGYDIDDQQKYYIRYEDNSIYRIYFTDFAGSGSGDLTFVMEDVSNLLGLENVSEGVTFGMYPNPSNNGMVNIVYDIQNTSEENSIEVYNMTGTQVFSTKANASNGFYNKTLNLSQLPVGVYVVSFISGGKSVSKKLIIK